MLFGLEIELLGILGHKLRHLVRCVKVLLIGLRGRIGEGLGCICGLRLRESLDIQALLC